MDEWLQPKKNVFFFFLGGGYFFAQYGIKTREAPGKNTGQTMQSLTYYTQLCKLYILEVTMKVIHNYIPRGEFNSGIREEHNTHSRGSVGHPI